MLSQILLANPVEPVPIPSDAIVFEATCTNGWESCTNTAKQYVNVEVFTQTHKKLSFKPSADLDNKTIVFRNTIATNPNSTYWQWYDGLGFDSSEQEYNLHAPNATLVFEALNPKDPSLKPNPESYNSASIGGGKGDLKITAKELHIGSEQYEYSGFFPAVDKPSDEGNPGVDPAALHLVTHRPSQKIEINANVFIHSDGFLVVTPFASDDRFTIRGNLFILGGDMMISLGNEPKINRPTLDVTGSALIKDAEIMTYLGGDAIYKKWGILGANGRITLEGNNQMMGMLVLSPWEYITADSATMDALDFGVIGDSRNLYQYTLKIENNGAQDILYAIPSLKNKLKDIPTLKLVTQAKKDLVEAFKTEINKKIQSCSASNPCDQSTLQAYENVLIALKGYLTNGNPSSGSITLTGFQAIDKKLKLLENPKYAQLVEDLKKANDLWAVELTSAFFQPKDNADKIRESFEYIWATGILPDSSDPNRPSIPNFPESPSNKHPLPPTTQTSRMIQENLGARLSITQRLSTYAFSKQGASRIKLQSPKEQEIQESKNKNQTELTTTSTTSAPSSSTPSSIQEINSTNLLSNLWFNLLGGANINGNKAGGSFGANVGYDKALENIVLGGYLSYGYLHSQDASFYSANSHAIEAGMYLRSDFSSHQIDFIFKSQIGISEITDTAETIDTKLTSNHISSFTQASLSYGYDFSTALIDVKPYVGISAGFAYISKPTGVFSHLDSQSNFSLGASIGLELKKYFSNNGFFYIIPSIEQGMLDTQQDIKIANSSNSFPIDSSLKTYAQILIGGEIELSSSWSLGVSLGVKQNIAGNKDEQGKWKNETYLMGNIGGVWRF